LEDNQETWLDFTDLVFVDPIGTGYSRPTKPEYGAEFYNTVGDAESVAEFIRVYRQRFDRFDSPLLLVGESYGTVRAHWVAEALERRRTTVSGMALISGFLRLDQEIPPALEEALLVPRFTTTAYYYKKLPSELQSGTLQQAIEKANRWAHETYAPALERLKSANPLSASEREAMITQLAQYAGVKPSLVEAQTLTISSSTFADRFLQEKGLDLGRYDTRLSARLDVNKIPWTTLIDPSLTPVLDVMQGTSPTIIRYFRSDLQYKSDLLYQGPFGEAYPKPNTPFGDWIPVNWGGGAKTPQGVAEYSPGLPGSGSAANIPLISPLRRAMELNPAMRVTIMTGMYDNAAPGIGCDYVSYSVSRIDPKLRDRVTIHCYVGGHMMYTDKLARQQMKRDMIDLVRTTTENSLSSAH
jgi:carboxypeptidase C (cathepsin A)